MEKSLIERVRPLASIKSRRLDLKGDIEDSLMQVIHDPVFQSHILKSIRSLPRRVPKEPTAPFVISKQFTGCVLSINHQWYTFRQDVTIVDILSAWLGPALATLLVFETLRAYARIKTLNSFEDAKSFNDPVRLYKLSSQSFTP